MTRFQTIQLILQSIPAIAVLVTLLFTFRQLRLNTATYRDLHEWNRRKAAYDAVQQYRDFAENAQAVGKAFETSRNFDSIPLERVKQILDADPTLQVHLHRYLNYFEELANGIRHGILDEDVVRSSLQRVMIINESRFRYYTEHLRRNGRPRAYCELEELVERWQKEANQAASRRRTGVGA